VAIADGLLYIADVTGALFCLDAETGRCLWTHRTKAEVWGSPLVVDGKIFLGTQKSLWALAAGREKKVLSEIRLGSPVWCVPVVANGVLYVASQQYLWAVKSLPPPNAVRTEKPAGERPALSHN
jgi:outer membrane protein assembly factor BamB